jgi:hypothetical protein
LKEMVSPRTDREVLDLSRGMVRAWQERVIDALRNSFRNEKGGSSPARASVLTAAPLSPADDRSTIAIDLCGCARLRAGEVP